MHKKVSILTRKRIWSFAFILLLIVGAPIAAGAQKSAGKTSKQKGTRLEGQSDFDFEIGNWKTKLRRLQRPLSGSTTWVTYEGTTIVRPACDGQANLVELKVSGPVGTIEGVSLRLFEPETKLWSLSFANMRGGGLQIPAVGSFKDGRGEFYNDDTYKDRKIKVRFIISDITPTSCHFEQAFSEDDGKTWEVNWIADDTRIKTAKHKAAKGTGKGR